MNRALGFAATLLLLLVAGCTGAGVEAVLPSNQVRLCGDDSSLRALRLAAAAYPAGPAVDFTFPVSAAGRADLECVRTGAVDLCSVSQPLEPSERSLGLQYAPLAADCVAVIANRDIDVLGLTTAQLRDVYSGRIRNWGELGGADLRIVVLDTPEEDTSKVALRKSLLGDTHVAMSAVQLIHEADLLGQVQRTPGAIGFASYGLVRDEGLEVRVLPIDGRSPSAEAARMGTYPAVRQLGIVYRDDMRSTAARFMDWATGPKGAEQLDKKGFGAAQAAAPR